MRIEVTPRRVELVEGVPFTVSLTVRNTGDVIGGYRIRVLGADPSWVRLSAENISLFPDTDQQVTATITVPRGLGAGARRIALQVKELTPPGAISVAEIDVVVPAQQAVKMALTPMTVVCGRTGRFGVVLENTGNTEVSALPVGTDPEAKVHFAFDPPVVVLAPGEHVVTDMRASARRRWFGSPVVRSFELGFPDPTAPLPDTGQPRPVEPLAIGTMLQKPRLSRGALSLISLLAAVSVFAVVITIAMGKLAGASAADRDLAIQVAQAKQNAGAAGSSALGGKVNLLAGGAPAAGVAVEIFSATALGSPLTSTATDSKGAWAAPGLADGTYKIRFRGAGFAEVWYPQAATATAAEPVTLAPGQKISDLAVTLGGLPATISGKVVGDNVAGAVLTVSVPAQNLPSVPTTGAATAPATSTEVLTGVPAGSQVQAPPRAAAPTTAPSTGATDSANDPGAAVKSVPIGADGTFTVQNIPSPAVYDITVVKAGFAAATQRIDLTAGEERSGIQLRLRTGDGLIAGTVSGPTGPEGGVIITATTGTTTVKTVSLTQGTVGAFTLRGLVTPGTYTVTVSKNGFATQSSTLTLAAGQKLSNLRFTLSRSAAALSGTVTLLPENSPAPGVSVVVTGGPNQITTVTQSAGAIGTWTVGGLPIPGAYTVTFSRNDLQSQTVAVSIDAAGNVSGGSATGGIAVGMTRATATVSGTVTQRSNSGTVSPVGEATITLASGTQSYSVTSASIPTDQLGHYEIAGVAPGTYTMSVSRRGTAPTSVIITVTAGQALRYDPVMVPSAGISGRVIDRSGSSTTGLQVMLYQSGKYPAEVYRSTVVDSQGRYSFSDVDAPQAYVVEVRSPSAGPLGSSTLVLGASQARALDLTIDTSGTSGGSGASTGTTTSTGPTTGSTR